jgi:hypothetical protein
MEKAFAKAEELADNVKEYFDTKIESVKLNAAEKSSYVIANLIAGTAALVVFVFFLVFGGMALSFGLGIWIGKTWAGFLIVAGFYLLVGIVVWTARGKIIRMPVMNALIQQLFKNDDEED